ncbi:hypothetical protein F4824DRAFT_37639 [Ustulina deusta]|nr:hypothetical protein F4824DRAFT_37639 [Ustulina deusta]
MRAGSSPEGADFSSSRRGILVVSAAALVAFVITILVVATATKAALAILVVTVFVVTTSAEAQGLRARREREGSHCDCLRCGRSLVYVGLYCKRIGGKCIFSTSANKMLVVKR